MLNNLYIKKCFFFLAIFRYFFSFKIRFSAILRGPVEASWKTLIASGAIKPDLSQLRAVSIVDQYFESLFRDHISESGKKQKLSAFDMSLFRTDGETENDHANVAEYTRRLARENRRMYLAQHGRAETRPRFLKQENLAEPEPVTPSLKPSQNAVSPPKDKKDTATLGLYMFGSVGRGKTMLMNLLSEALSSDRVRRVHFFDFMKSVHEGMITGKTVENVANEIADSIDIILLDEVAISDVQDCAIFPSVMQILLKRKVGFVITSNQHPQSLYANGLNRHIFLPPLLELLKSHARLVNVDDPEADQQIDFRLNNGGRNWSWSNTGATQKIISKIEIPLSPTRELEVCVADSESVLAWVDQLIVGELSESDYLKIASFLKENELGLKLVIDRAFEPVDILGPARRFGKLIEVLYDQECRLAITSVVRREELFRKITREELDRTGAVGDSSDSLASNLASSAVDEALRAVSRCVSRLSECRVD